MLDLNLLKIDRTESIAAAFKLLNANRAGILFVTDSEGRVLGAVTDGDIRRHLLQTDDTGDAIEACMNPDFVRVEVGASREQVLKLLDHRIRAIPQIDERGRLRDVLSRERFRLERERRVFTRGRSPVRISFGGGGTDLTRHFSEHGAVVMNAAISLYSHASLRRLDDGSVRIYSQDLNREVAADRVNDLDYDGGLDLIVSLIKLIEPDFGFELQIGSDYPAGSGLGGSAVVAAAVIGCFNQYREDRWDRHQIAEMAFQAERLQLNIPGGWQDQYATVFGGFNFIEFTNAHNMVLPLRLESDTVRELEASLLLCYTGGTHDSGEMHRQIKDNDIDATAFAEESRRLTMEMKRLLLRGQLLDYGRLLGESWELKKRFSPQTTTPEIDAVYASALANGALGGRLLGAGGGGYFLFYAKPFHRYGLTQALRAKGLETRDFVFDNAGLQSWTVRAEAEAK